MAFDPRKAKVKRMRAPGAITGSTSIPSADNSAESLDGAGYDEQANEPGTEMGYGSEVGTEPAGIDDLMASRKPESPRGIMPARPGQQPEEQGAAVNNAGRKKKQKGPRNA